MKITPIIASRFKSDGGTMFGLVPKTIWSRMLQPDIDNRIKQHAHVLLLELDDGRKGLIDTGCGPERKFSEKQAELHGLGNGWPLDENLKKKGVSRESLDFIIFTHLHWDHAGGASCGTGSNAQLSFPKAVHYIHAKEWKDAVGSDPLLFKSYPRDTIDPLIALPKEQLVFVNKDRQEILPGVSMVRSGGHTAGHCVIELEHETGIELDHPEAMFMFTPRKIIFAGDVCPMHQNLRLVYQTSYDTYPMDTRKWKHDRLAEIAADRALLMFDHDPVLFGATIRRDEKREYVIDKTLHTAYAPDHALPIDELTDKGAKEKDREKAW